MELAVGGRAKIEYRGSGLCAEPFFDKRNNPGSQPLGLVTRVFVVIA